MKYLKYIFPLLLLACTMSQEKVSNDEETPNIVLIIGDDQGYPYFGFMGADYVQTPHMDALAASGTVFTQGYVPDNHCRPSLQTLMTSTLPISYKGEVANKLQQEKSKSAYQEMADDERAEWEQNFQFHSMKYFETFPEILAKTGYRSFQGGKWWEYNYQNGGFTHGMTTGWTPEDRKDGSKWFKQFMGGTGLELARATMEPVYEFIDQNRDQPFFLWFAPELPHYPFDAPEKYYNLYKGAEMSESAKRYYANCTWFDDGVGALVSHLKKTGEFKNTLFVYVNDNGWEQNPDQEFRHDSLRWHNGGDKGKLSLYDQSFRTPIIFSWEGKIATGARKNALIHSADIPATLLDYLDIDIPESYFGQSYRPVIEGSQSQLRQNIIGNITQTRWEGDMMGRRLDGYWLRNQDWFFSWNVTDGIKSLYNMNKDPFNDINLAQENPELVDSFTRAVKAWKTQVSAR